MFYRGMTARKTYGESGVSWHLKLLLPLLAAGLALAQPSRTYQDPQGRFEFRYPALSLAALPQARTTVSETARHPSAFRNSPPGVHGQRIILGGEAVLTKGPPQIDLQAAGGLYDPIGIQVFPDSMAATIRKALPVLTAATFCDSIGREQHLAPGQKPPIADADRLGNAGPKVSRCDVSGDTVTFDKEAALQPGGPSRHIYGAVRFLPAPWSTFQLIRGSADAPDAALLRQITAVVNSWNAK